MMKIIVVIAMLACVAHAEYEVPEQDFISEDLINSEFSQVETDYNGLATDFHKGISSGEERHGVIPKSIMEGSYAKARVLAKRKGKGDYPWRHVFKPKISCPLIRCAIPPRRCPKGSTLRVPKSLEGCKGCTTCLNDKKQRVKVPKCWRASISPSSKCIHRRCARGAKLKLVKPAGKNGAWPCCPQYKCVGGHRCPQFKCMRAPWKCPKGSNIGRPVFHGCKGCLTCLRHGKAVAVPKCYRRRHLCVRPKCPAGQDLTTVIVAGAHGKVPCCPTYKCQGRPPAGQKDSSWDYEDADGADDTSAYNYGKKDVSNDAIVKFDRYGSHKKRVSIKRV